MPFDANTIKFVQDLVEIVIGAVQDGSINQIGIWAGHHLRLIIIVFNRFILMPYSI